MADEPRAQEVPDASQDSPMPSDKPEATPQTNEAASPQGESTQEVTGDEPQLPEGVKERTSKEFDKLRTQLSAERQKRLQYEALFNRIDQNAPQPAQSGKDPIFDPETGDVDTQQLVQRLQLAEQRAARAEATTRQSAQEQQEREAYSAYPELNPSSDKFDPSLHRITRAILTDSMMNPGDYGEKILSFKEAGDMAKQMSPKQLEEAEKKGATEALEKLAPKEQAALEASGRSDRRQDVSNMQNLQEATRRNDLGAIMERLKNIPPAGK